MVNSFPGCQERVPSDVFPEELFAREPEHALTVFGGAGLQRFIDPEVCKVERRRA
jgi:hypothetical protein